VRKVVQRVDAQAEKVQRRLIYALVIWADDLVADIKAEFRRVGAVDTGELVGSVSRTSPRRVGKVKIRVVIFSPKEYAAIIEFGRRARVGKPPPLLPLVGWAKRHGITRVLPANISFDGKWAKHWSTAFAIGKRARKGGKGRRKAKTKPMNPIVRGMLVVIGIQRAIHRRGVKGRRPMTRIFDTRVKSMKSDIVQLASTLP